MARKQKLFNRRVISWLVLILLSVALCGASYLVGREVEANQPVEVASDANQTVSDDVNTSSAAASETTSNLAVEALEQLEVKEAESGDDYERSNFSSGWASWRDCNVRQKILNRDIKNIQLAANGCTVVSGTLEDPYTGKTIELTTKSAVSNKVQIDHVVALSNAWQTGARYLTADERKALANDDLELIAVSSSANQDKSDGDASEWLPENEGFRCTYVARQIAVKTKYKLWVTIAEKSAIKSILATCPNEPLPAE